VLGCPQRLQCSKSDAVLTPQHPAGDDVVRLEAAATLHVRHHTYKSSATWSASPFSHALSCRSTRPTHRSQRDYTHETMAARYHPGSTRSRAQRNSASSPSSEADMQRTRSGRQRGVTQPIIGRPSTTSIYGTPAAVRTYEHKPTIRPKRSLEPEETSIVSKTTSQPPTCVCSDFSLACPLL
jgi:hypothetical protein